MKKFSVILLVLALVCSACFAEASKESNGAEITEKKGNEVSSTPIISTELKPVSSAGTPSSPATQETPVVSTALTSVSTPIYRVELYDTTTITKQDVDEAVSYYSSQLGYQVSSDEVLNDLIDKILFQQALEKALTDKEIDVYDGEFNSYVSYQLQVLASNYGYSIASAEDAEMFLNQFGSTYNDFANECLTGWAQEKFIENYDSEKLNSISEPTEEEIQKAYETNKDYFISDEFMRVAHIFTYFGEDKEAAKSKADKALESIKNGVSFEKVCLEFSEDKTSSQNGGLLDLWIGHSDQGMAEAFGEEGLEAMFALEVGDFSEVVTGTQGYHIFKCINKKNSTPLALDDVYDPNLNATVRQFIIQQMLTQKYQETYASIYQSIIDDLRSKATLKSLI